MPSSNVIPLRRRSTSVDPGTDLGRLALRAPGSPSDLRLLVETLEGHPGLRSLASRLARGLSSHGADDLLQHTLERVVRGLASYRGSGDFLGWVGRIMRNAQIEIVRREVRARTHVEGGVPWGDGEGPEDPAEALGEREMHERVLEAWRRRSGDADVRLFWDRVYVGLSVEQLIRRTGRPRSTVYLMLQRGGRKLATELRALLGEGRMGS